MSKEILKTINKSLINEQLIPDYDYLITTREMFDNIFSFKDLQYYRRKLKYLHIELLIIQLLFSQIPLEFH